MKSPIQLADEIYDYASLLNIILAGPDADSAIDGMHRLTLIIRANAELIIKTIGHERARARLESR